MVQRALSSLPQTCAAHCLARPHKPTNPTGSVSNLASLYSVVRSLVETSATEDKILSATVHIFCTQRQPLSHCSQAFPSVIAHKRSRYVGSWAFKSRSTPPPPPPLPSLARLSRCGSCVCRAFGYAIHVLTTGGGRSPETTGHRGLRACKAHGGRGSIDRLDAHRVDRAGRAGYDLQGAIPLSRAAPAQAMRTLSMAHLHPHHIGNMCLQVLH